MNENTLKIIENLYCVSFDDYLKKYYGFIIIDIFFNNNLTYSKNDIHILNIYGIYYKNKINNYDEMKKYLLKAIELNDKNAMFNLAMYYRDIEKNYDLMEEYLLMASELNDELSIKFLEEYHKINNICNKINNIKI